MAKHPKAKRIVLILFDFMGYADIEPFGSGEIRTPNIRGSSTFQVESQQLILS